MAKGRSREDALKLVIIEWLLHGDTEPLTAAIAEGELDDPVLSVIAMMLTHDDLPYRLTVQRRPGRGAPKKPGRRWRGLFMAMIYQQLRTKLGSEAAFAATAEYFRLDVSSVKAALTDYRQLLDPPTTNKSPKT